MRLTVRVPATSANLGPGFDCFGLALDLCNEVTIDTEAEPGVSWEGEGADELPTDGSDLVSRAMAHVEDDAQQSFDEEIRLPPMRLHGINRIPMQRGLGSSSAAVLAGVALAETIIGFPESSGPLLWVSLALPLEGHPDNVTAAAFGGFTLASSSSVARLDPHPDIRPVVLVPERIRLATVEARRVLPATVPFADAVFNVQQAASMVHAMTIEPRHLWNAMTDRLHQDARLGLVPEVREVFDRLLRVPLPVCVSGAGPSLLTFDIEGYPVPDLGEGWHVLRLPVRATGVEVLPS